MTSVDEISRTTGEEAPPRRPQTRRTGTRYRTWVIGGRVLVAALLLAAWELGAGRVFDDFFTSRPSAIWTTWWGWLVDGTLWYNASSTLFSAGLGFAIGGTAALIFGYALGVNRYLSDLLEPFITGIYSLPKIALVPLLVLWVGVGRPLQLAIAGLVAFFLMFYNVYFGIRDVDRDLINAMKIMGASRTDIALRVRMPAALVWVVAGLKISVPQTLVAVVVAEILASNRGLGHLVASNASQFNTAGTFAALFSLLIVGLTVDRVVGYLSGRALRWRRNENSAQR
jgi:NitT/TauT family transport system permease protein